MMRQTPDKPRTSGNDADRGRRLSVLVAAGCGLVCLMVWRGPGAAPTAFPVARAAVPDFPTNLAVDEAGDVWVTMGTDTGEIGLDRYSSALAYRRGFMSIGDIHDLAGMPGGGMVMDLSIPVPDQPDLPALSLISRLSDSLEQLVAWDLGLGEVDYVRSISVEKDGTIDILIAGDAGYTEIRRFSPAGAALDRTFIEPWALDMAVGEDGIRYVVYDDPDAPRVMRYSSDGGLAGSFKLPAVPTGIALAPDGRIFIPSHEGVGDNSRVERFKPDGTSDGGFKVTGRCWKLAVGPDGSLYAIIEVRPRWSIQRLSATGGQRGIVEWEQMQRRRGAHPATVTALPAPPSSTPSPTATLTPTAAPTRRPPTRTPSPTPGTGPGPSDTAAPPTRPAAPTATPPITGGGRIFFPAILRAARREDLASPVAAPGGLRRTLRPAPMRIRHARR